MQFFTNLAFVTYSNIFLWIFLCVAVFLSIYVHGELVPICVYIVEVFFMNSFYHCKFHSKLQMLATQIATKKHCFTNTPYHLLLNNATHFLCLSEQIIAICFTKIHASHGHVPLTFSTCHSCLCMGLYVAIQYSLTFWKKNHYIERIGSNYLMWIWKNIC